MSTLERTAAERADGIRKGIEQHGKLFRGRKELLKHLDGERLTMKETIIAKCYDCMGHYYDPGKDCKIQHCPLYSFMIYREEGKGAFRAKQNTPFNDATDELGAITSTRPLQDDPLPVPEVINSQTPSFLCGIEGRA